MKTLIIDTSHKLLCVGVLIDDKVVASYQQEAQKRQSEHLIREIDTLLKQLNVSPMDLSHIVVTNGPGSYTGLRIGLTFVKTFALVNPHVKVFTVNTLLSIAGMRDGFAFIDARSGRTFGATVKNGAVFDEKVYSIDAVEAMSCDCYGDMSLLGLRDDYGNVIENILAVQSAWCLVENPDVLVPNYLK